MATYVVGDIQGCFAPLERLLAQVDFAPRRDRLWLVGDLVNRGPSSLEVLRFVRDLGDRATVVLGNHDLHLIARASGIAPAKRRDTLDEVLRAPDCDELVGWLRQRPFLHQEGRFVMVHAGLLPTWTVPDATRLARELEHAIRGEAIFALLSGEHPLSPALGAFVRLRTCTERGELCDFDGPPADAPAGCLPWFAIPSRRSRDVTVLFGHWSALGLHVSADAIGLDTGCVWGRELTCFRLEDGAVFSEPAEPPSEPHG